MWQECSAMFSGILQQARHGRTKRHKTEVLEHSFFNSLPPLEMDRLDTARSCAPCRDILRAGARLADPKPDCCIFCCDNGTCFHGASLRAHPFRCSCCPSAVILEIPFSSTTSPRLTCCLLILCAHFLRVVVLTLCTVSIEWFPIPLQSKLCTLASWAMSLLAF